MKRTLLLCALATGFSGAAQAQSNVQVYGIMDAGYTFRDADGEGTRHAVDSGISSGSRLGFRGSEDIGNGLKLGFRLETGVNADLGTAAQSGRAFGRASWLSLAGSFGEVRVGRQNALGYDWFAGSVSPWGTNFLQANPETIFGYKAVADRVDNGLYYYSPNFSGFQAAAGYARDGSGDETLGNEDDTSVTSLALRYQNGPLMAVLTYDRKNVADSNTAAGRDDVQNLSVGATYDFKVVKLHLGYGQLENRDFIADAEKEKAWLLGASLPIGDKSKLMVAYQRVNDARNVNEFGAAHDSARSGFAVVYDYALSKRTSLYAYGSRYSDVVLDQSRATPKTGDATEFALGLRHSF